MKKFNISTSWRRYLKVLFIVVTLFLNNKSAHGQSGTDMYNAIDAGTFEACGTVSSYQDNRSNISFANTYGGSSGDIWYKFTVTTATLVNISHCGTGIATNIHLIDGAGLLIKSAYGNGPLCQGNNASLSEYLYPGVFYLVSEGNNLSSGYINTSFNSGTVAPAGSAIYSPIVVGQVAPSGFVDTQNSGNCFGYGGPGISNIYYQFNLSAPKLVKLSHCGSSSFAATKMFLLDEAGDIIASNDGSGPLCNGIQASIEMELTAGVYYVISEAPTHAGNITTQIQVEPPPFLGISPSQDQNYILALTPRKAGYTSSASVFAATVSANEVMADIQYFDGLGRPMQNVQVKGNGAADKDIVVPIAYDQYGRQVRTYLPYASESSNGSYKPEALTAQQNYYQNPGAGVVQTQKPYAEAVYEASPLSRILEQGSPGLAWQPIANSQAGHTQKMAYEHNASGEVKLWKVTANGATGNTNYAAGELYKTIAKDENWTETDLKAGTAEEFKDKKGRVVLKRTWETDVKSLSTYYVYDDLGNLRYVLPPAINENGQSLTSFIESDDAFTNYCYAYRYDGRKRLIEKKLPGKGWEYMVYNSLDQVVLTQDANQRAKTPQQWLFTKYDALGRVLMTGIYADNLHTNQGINSFRQDYQNLANGDVNLWESRNNSTATGYSNNCFPQANNSLLTINYYDDYTFPGNIFGVPTIAYQSVMTTGLLTGTKTTILGSSDMLLSVNFYDDNGRVLQNMSQNRLAGLDRVDNTYSFTGELLTSNRTHIANNATTTIGNIYTYDHIGRAKATTSSINSAVPTTLSNVEYNEIGQILSKTLHNGLQSTSYSYNERGWLKTQISPQFSLQLKYQDGSIPQYNGNIANQLFDNGGNGSYLTFNYSYDRLNRLTKGEVYPFFLSEVLTYDIMGNVRSLNRDNIGAKIYTYKDGGNSNQLHSVADVTATTYAYDANGNATTDGRNLKTITYNYLNLPQTVSGGIVYTYDATGKKLQKQSGTTATTTEYVDGIQYTNGVIDFIQTEEGVARRNGTSYSYEYNLTDHLANVRASFYQNPTTNNLQVLQRDNYYAFGKRKVLQGGTNKYLYNGKEVQDELSEQYDYGARFYDPVIGRWNAIDPHAHNYVEVSPYSYALNNPLIFVDPDGRDVINADAERLNKAKEAQQQAKQNYDKASGGKTEKADFTSKDDYKAFKRAERDLRATNREMGRAQSAFNNTQSAIDNFKAVDPEGFKQADNLTYSDKSGTTHKLDIRVSTGTLPQGVEKGVTAFSVNVVTGRVTGNAVHTTLGSSTLTTSSVLAHEFGHGIAIARNPASYYISLQGDSGFNCQDPKNRSNPLSVEALNWQYRYEKLNTKK